MNRKVLIALAVIGLGVSDRANAMLRAITDMTAQDMAQEAVALPQLPPTQLAEGNKLGDKYPSGQAGGRYGVGAGSHLLKGDEFIIVMQSNTLSGTTAAGDAFNMYFLPGGTVAYRDVRGARDSGMWHLNNDGVCVTWRNPGAKEDGCFRVLVEGHKVTLEGSAGSTRATLRGGVAETFLDGTEQQSDCSHRCTSW